MAHLSFGQKLSNNVKFVAGFPDFIYRPIDHNEVYTTATLKIKEDSLLVEEVLTDSLQLLYFLRCYPEKNYLISLVGNKQNQFDFINIQDYSFILYDTKNNIKKVVPVPSMVSSKKVNYSFNPSQFSSIISNDDLTVILTYNNFEIPKNGSNSRIIYCEFSLFNGSITVVNPIKYKETISNGNSFILKNNNEGELLQGDVENNSLKIPTNASFFDKAIFVNKLPEDVVIKSNYYAGKVLINNDLTLVLYLYEKENQTEWNLLKFRIYDKIGKDWSFFKLETSIVNMKSFGRWLCGNYKIKEANKNKEDFSKEDWVKRKTQFGPSYKTLIDTDESYKFISKGNLYVFNMDNQNVIKWETGNGDSEILLIDNNTIYYRVTNKLFRVPIIEGKRLGEPTILIEDNRVGDIHWAFISNH